MYKYNTPQELFTAICDKIRDKTNSNELINHQDIPDKIDNLVSSGIIKLLMDSAIQKIDTVHYNFNGNITKIESTIFAGTKLKSIDLSKCTSIGPEAFCDCTSLTIENLPECTSIGSNTFRGCTNLTTIDLPKCTSINYSAFRECNNLTTINLPKCTYIGNGPGLDEYHAFYDCSNLTTVIFGDAFSSSIPSVFCNTPIEDGTGYIYVPDNALNEYRSNNPNYQFKPISELPSNLKEEYGYE